MPMKTVVEKVKDFIAKRKMEQMQAVLSKHAGVIDYIAMMANVEIPEEEDKKNVV